MTVVPSYTTLQPELSAVRLARYAQIIGYDERPFFGLKPADTAARHACGDVWTKRQRDAVQKYLWEAQLEIEQQVMYPLEARWIADDDFYSDDQPFDLRMLARFRYVQEAGIRAVADISIGAAVDHAADPAVIGPVAIPAGATAYEIHVYHPGTDVEIPAARITIAGGNATIEIPRARLVAVSYADNPADGWDYADVAPGVFDQTVDVKRVYNDPSIQATLSRPQNCQSCASQTGSACIRIVDRVNGHLHVVPSSTPCRCRWGMIRLYYRAGPWVLSAQAEDAIVRLAHAKMPEDPCGCDPAQELWRRDRSIPEGFIPDERLNSPWGVADGAWMAWKFTQAMTLPRGRVL